MGFQHYEGDARDLALDFTVTEELFGKHTTVELRPGGADIPVTNENKLQYVHAMADYKLNRQVRPSLSIQVIQCQASQDWICRHIHGFSFSCTTANGCLNLNKYITWDIILTSLFWLQMKPLINAFAKGMSDIIAPAWLGLFNAKEFNQVRILLPTYTFF